MDNTINLEALYSDLIEVGSLDKFHILETPK